MRIWLLLLILIGTRIIGTARNLNVEIVSEESGKAIVGLNIIATISSGEKVGDGKFNEKNQTYIFNDLPSGELLLCLDDNPRQTLKIITEDDKDYVKIEISDGLCENNKPATQLAEVEVVAASQYVTRHGMTFIPNKKQKKTSHSGVSLLQRMGIPSLKINPTNDNVTTMMNEEVSFFIDYVEADKNIIANIWPKDVEKVEVLENPTDPRFKNARHVVNFIMAKYEWGGYTKLNGRQTLEELYGFYSAYSKAVYRRMTYEVGIGADFQDSQNIGSSNETEYIFPNSPLRINENSYSKHQKRRGWYAIARIGYNDEKNNVTNNLTYVGDKKPRSSQKGEIRYDPPVYEDSEQQTTNNSNYSDIMWENNDTFNLGNGWSLTCRPMARYTTNEYTYLYQTSDTQISNIASGKKWLASANCCGWKQIGNHRLYLQAEGYVNANYLKYEGSNPSYEIARSHSFGFQTGGIFQFGKIKTSLNVGLFWHSQSIGNYSDTQARGILTEEFSYFINQKNSINFQLDWNMPQIDISKLNPNLIVQTGIFGRKGNEFLDHYHVIDINIGYNCLPLNNFGLYGYLGWGRDFNPIVPIYNPEEFADHEIMVQSYDNRGFKSTLYAGVSANLNLFENALNIGGNINYKKSVMRTGFNIDTTTFMLQARIQYNWRNFFISAYYQSPFADMNFSGRWEQPSYYNMTLGYGNGDIYVDFEMRNIFRDDWKYNESYYISEKYTTKGNTYGGILHRNFSITLTYTFGYGKKVNRNSEISKGSFVNVGI